MAWMEGRLDWEIRQVAWGRGDNGNGNVMTGNQDQRRLEWDRCRSWYSRNDRKALKPNYGQVRDRPVETACCRCGRVRSRAQEMHVAVERSPVMSDTMIFPSLMYRIVHCSFLAYP